MWPEPVWVVKLGGSLDAAGTLKPWIDALAAAPADRDLSRRRPLRRPRACCPSAWRVDDRTAHRMAILAMEQTAHLLCGLWPELSATQHSRELATSSIDRGRSVWFPAAELLDDADIPGSWDITSDSLAAVLAGRIGARGLAVVKSAPLPAGPVHAGQIGDLLDVAFADYGSRCGCPVWLLYGADSSSFERLVVRGEGGVRVRFEPEGGSCSGCRGEFIRPVKACHATEIVSPGTQSIDILS